MYQMICELVAPVSVVFSIRNYTDNNIIYIIGYREYFSNNIMIRSEDIMEIRVHKINIKTVTVRIIYH